MNVLQSTDKRMKAYKENSITSFNNAANHALDYIEFDVQVTKDNIPIIFHDNFIVSAENGQVVEKRVTDLTVDEFFSYGPQRTSGQVGKSLLRQINGNILKFDDYVVYEEEYLIHVLQVILKVVYENAQERPVLFSTFQPDVALLMKKLQHTYPVYFLTNGGNEIYDDVRMNSLEEAKKLALEGGLDGIVSEVKGIFRNPSVVREIKESNLSLLTYGKLNNVLKPCRSISYGAVERRGRRIEGDGQHQQDRIVVSAELGFTAMWRIKDWVDNERDGVPFVIYWIFNCTWKRVELHSDARKMKLFPKNNKDGERDIESFVTFINQKRGTGRDV
ncbi:glycerophosphodiester phosphodiesterase GDPD2-like protein [Tanacetum coccineum]